jgi:hypothetical protein
MPVTARFSERFYQKFGDEVTNELVDWLNAVDTSYRREFRELFDANFGRLDDRMDGLERLFDARFGRLDDRMDGLERLFDARFGRLDDRANGLEQRFDARFGRLDDRAKGLEQLFDANFGRLEARMAELRSELRAESDVRFAEVRAGMKSLEARIDARLEFLKSELLRWMFLFWVGTMGTVLAILKL